MLAHLARGCAAITVLAILGAPALAQDTRALTNVTGDVYRFQNNFHNGMVVITDAGVVVADPINTDAAAWLEAEIATLTDQPVTHLVYSHSHGDHASGGKIFADTAEVIAHENAPETIDGVPVETRIGDSGTLEVGGKTLEFTYLGEGHGEDLIAVVVRPENVAFVVDAVSTRRLPWRDFGGADIDGMIGQVEVVQGLDFDILLPGHGGLGTEESVDEVLTYMETLRAEVLAGLEAGKSVEELQAEIMLADYADWQGYEDWRALNIEGAAKSLQASGAVN